MKITTRGRVTIPKEIRERFGLLPDSEVAFHVDGDRVYLERVCPEHLEVRTGRGQELVRKMRSAATVPTTTDEIMALTRD